MLAAYQSGIIDFGENQVQSAQSKITTLADLPINWHFIGTIQSNKLKKIAQLFSWIQSITTIDQATAIANTLPEKNFNICVQVKLGQKEPRNACLLDDCEKLFESILKLPNINLRGLMYLPENNLTNQQLANNYQTINQQFKLLAPRFNLDTLSIGMSNDYKIAIQNGSTMIRPGNKIFNDLTNRN